MDIKFLPWADPPTKKRVRWRTSWWWYPRVIKDAIWWVRHRADPNHRYHVVKTDLKPGFHDIDEVMLYAWMKLMRIYVETENGGYARLREFADELAENSDRNNPESQAFTEAEACEIYSWWMFERPEDYKHHWATPLSDSRYFARDEELKVKDDLMLNRMLKIRHSLWT